MDLIMTAISPIRLPTLAFVVNPEGQAGIVYDSPTGKRTVIARGPFLFAGSIAAEAVHRVGRLWAEPFGHKDAMAALAGSAFRELVKVDGWALEVAERALAKVLAGGEL